MYFAGRRSINPPAVYCFRHVGVMSLKRILGMIIILAVGCYFAVYITFLSIPAAEVFNNVMPDTPVGMYNTLESGLYDFIGRNLTGKEGEILTNLRSNNKSGDTLSESLGLMMNYCTLSNKRVQYEKQFKFLQNRLLTEGNFIRWRAGGSSASCNAAIDDLRIIRALLDGYDLWGVKEYYNMAGYLQESIFTHQVKDRCLHELYDWKSGKTKHTSPLCYLDLYAMDRMSEFNPGWLAVEEKALSILSEGRISSKSPFFYKYYDYDTGKYSYDEEYYKDKGICLTYTLYNVLHLAEVNEETGYFLEWLKNEAATGKLYAWYDPLTRRPAGTAESTAVYALAAVYASKSGEKELSGKLIEQMLKFMVTDRKSTYYGGFGDTEMRYFHSFDNLTALWALTAADE